MHYWPTVCSLYNFGIKYTSFSLSLSNQPRPYEAIWRHISGKTLAQAIACYLTIQAITWTTVDLSSLQCSNIHMRAVSQEMAQPWITQISLKIIDLKSHLHLPGSKWVKIMRRPPAPHNTTNMNSCCLWIRYLIPCRHAIINHNWARISSMLLTLDRFWPIWCMLTFGVLTRCVKIRTFRVMLSAFLKIIFPLFKQQQSDLSETYGLITYRSDYL